MIDSMFPEEFTVGDAAALLAMVSSYDGRSGAQAEIEAWFDAGTRARWTYTEADEVIKQHFAFDAVGSWLTPGQVTQLIRAARRDRRDREAGSKGHAVVEGGYSTGDDPHWGRRNSAELEALWSEYLSVGCPAGSTGCGQPAGERCKNPVSGSATKIPHIGRIKAAEKGQVDHGS